MKVSVFGTGYVGLVTGACLAKAGNDVICMDVDQVKVSRLRDGDIPIHEPGLKSIVVDNVAAGRLSFTTSSEAAVAHGEFLFIAVGTPPDEDGSADLQYVLAVAESIGRHLNQKRIVVNKSTVPVGTADLVAETIQAQLTERGISVNFAVVSNPEFLKEGAAVEDCLKPDRIVIGSSDAEAVERMRLLYAPFNRNHERVLVMDERSAELTKYAANAMLATKISFMNEVANLAESVGADVERVRQGIGSDPRIGFSFIYPGAGYGGSCFPKDVQALARTGADFGHPMELLQAVERVNNRQKQVLFGKVNHHFDGDLDGKTFALWGLAFKPNTNDMRAASSRVLMEDLWSAGAKVRAFDPEAMGETRRIYGERPDLTLCKDVYDTLADADALIIVTEWQSFRSPDFDRVQQQLNYPVVFDGRNLFDPEAMANLGFTYYGIGRGASVRKIH